MYTQRQRVASTVLNLRLGVMMALIALSGCETTPPPTAPSALPPIELAVSGSLAQTLDESGLFILREPSGVSEGLIISPERARALAVADIRTYGSFFLEMLEKEHGASIRLDQIAISDRVYYVESPYLLPASAPIAIQRAYAPFYVMHELIDGMVVTSHAVSAYNFDYQIESTGRLVRPAVGAGGAFWVRGVPLGTQTTLPMPPERAVQVVAAMTGTRASAIPALIWGGISRRTRTLWPRHVARWQVVLEAPVRARGRLTGRIYDLRQIYVEPTGALSAALPVQAPPPPAPYIPHAGAERVLFLELPPRSSVPTQFEPIDILRN